MGYPVFYVPAGDVLPIFFDSYDGGTGASITMSGLAVTDIEIYKDGSATQRSSDAGYTLLDTDGIDFDTITGIHGFSIDTSDNTDASFYTVGAWFTVVVSAVTIDAQTVNFVAAMFRIMKAESIAGVPKADVDAWLGTAAATPTVNGVPEVDVTHWIGTAAATPTVAGVPEVDITHIGGTGVTAASGIPEVKVASIAASAITATAIAADAIGASELAADAVAEIADGVWDEVMSGHVAVGSAGAANFIIRSNTAQAGAGTTITLDASASAVDDFYNYNIIIILSGTGVGQSRIVSDYVGATKVATVATWATNPDNTSVFAILPLGQIPGATAPTAAEVADAVWDEATAGHVAAGSFGKLAADVLEDTGTTLDDFLDTEIAAIKAKTDNLPAAPAAVGDIPTAAAIADAVWDEDATAHQTQGTFGQAIGDPVADTNTIFKATVTDAAGATVGVDTTAIAGYVDTEVADIRTRVLLALPAVAPAANGGLGTVDANNYIAGIAGTKNQLDDLNDLSAAQVNAEVDSALDTAIPAPTAGSINERIKTMDDADIPGRLPAALSGGKMDSVADVTAISGDTTAADKLEAALDGTLTATVNDAGASTTAFITTLGSAVDDYYNGRILTFNTGALAGQQREITDYVGATKTVTVAALTSAPANGVAFTVT